MRIETPLGPYEYHVRRARITRRGVEVSGSLGEWETTTVLGPRDVAVAATPLLGVLALLALARRAR
jgi:hypothetical protein